MAKEPEVIECFVNKDDNGVLHCEDGPAMTYPNNWEIYCWHGMQVEEKVIMHPEQITVEEVDAQENAERRRVYLERMGLEKYITESNAELIHEDEYGKLYRREFGDGSVLRVVRVANTTPNEDGSKREYFLGIPADIVPQTAKEAVAATFGKTVEEYSPEAES